MDTCWSPEAAVTAPGRGTTTPGSSGPGRFIYPDRRSQRISLVPDPDEPQRPARAHPHLGRASGEPKLPHNSLYVVTISARVLREADLDVTTAGLTKGTEFGRCERDWIAPVPKSTSGQAPQERFLFLGQGFKARFDDEPKEIVPLELLRESPLGRELGLELIMTPLHNVGLGEIFNGIGAEHEVDGDEFVVPGAPRGPANGSRRKLVPEIIDLGTKQIRRLKQLRRGLFPGFGI